jgi:hypothetical protein
MSTILDRNFRLSQSDCAIAKVQLENSHEVTVSGGCREGAGVSPARCIRPAFRLPALSEGVSSSGRNLISAAAMTGKSDAIRILPNPWSAQLRKVALNKAGKHPIRQPDKMTAEESEKSADRTSRAPGRRVWTRRGARAVLHGSLHSYDIAGGFLEHALFKSAAS